MKNKLEIPSEEVLKALDNTMGLPADQHFRYTARFYPADRNLDRHIVSCRNQQVVKNWSTSTDLHRSTNIDILDSNMYFNERHIRQIKNGTHVILAKFDRSIGSVSEFKKNMITAYKSQMFADRTCIINLSFSEN